MDDADQRHKAASGSLHQRILSDVKDKILSGEWPPGHRIPFEHELASTYACSRMTVNKVLTQLVGTGLIERRRKAGSFVMRPQSQSAVLKIQDIGREVTALGLAYRFDLSARQERAATERDIGRIDLGPGAPLLDLTCCHFAGSQPFCIEERLISLNAVPEAVDADFALSPPGTWLMQRVPWTNAEHTIRAAAAGKAVAAMLAITERSPCLIIERKTWSAGQPITFVRLTYPSEAHQLVARFEPSDT
ncbi:histidine utilization repressor [Lichenifustis flavocetrariae]|uniref:Histidine utilization repressor n=1 Tax=Lichenifustis flavocetrariae TaxID=2949735 RepID=A0AA41YX17_9HYPH|nr:histidine utilization repressor [Lichenifustis flavocetrariae]MCW6510146.1 histidine utilization repressor [Lichenifustis flavocetrariae]